MPTNDPFNCTPPDIVKRDNNRIMKGTYSRSPTCNNSYIVICNPCVRENGIINSNAQNNDIFPKPEGDISLSPDGNWIVNGYNNKFGSNFYTIFNLESGEWVKTPSFDTGFYKKDLRIDPAPRWNHENNQILVSGLDKNGIRQLFIISIHHKPF